MITMVEKNSILISYYRDGDSISSISRDLKISRKTIRKYINEHEDLLRSKDLTKHLEKGLLVKPSYDTTSRTKIKLTTEIEDDIKSCLDLNRQKRTQGLHKQLMKKIDIYEYLQSKGIEISYTTVCNYIRNSENKSKESFIKQVYSPGGTCEFDWGEAKIKIAGIMQTLNLGVFTSAFGNYRWSKLFHRQDTLAFSQSHIDFFSYTNGVYHEMVYDNMRVVISKFVGRTEKEPTVALLELSNYYKFHYRFCNTRKGNEKGHVERSVEYIRRKAFCKKDEFSSIEEANNYLQNICNKLNIVGQKLKENKTANELFEEEKIYLYKISSPYKCFKDEYAKVDKYSTVILYGNRYSVPDFLVGKLLDIKVFAEKISVYLNNEQVCSHIRSYGPHTWTLDINHYLSTFARKPGALKGSLALSQLCSQIKNIYTAYFRDDSRDFIELLQYAKQEDLCFDIIEIAIKKVKQITPTSISKDKILAIINKDKETTTKENKDTEIYNHSQVTLKELTTLLNLKNKINGIN